MSHEDIKRIRWAGWTIAGVVLFGLAGWIFGLLALPFPFAVSGFL